MENVLLGDAVFKCAPTDNAPDAAKFEAEALLGTSDPLALLTHIILQIGVEVLSETARKISSVTSVRFTAPGHTSVEPVVIVRPAPVYRTRRSLFLPVPKDVMPVVPVS